MIIDVHYHFMRLPQDDTAARNMLSSLVEDARRTGYAKPLEELLPEYRDIMDDVECDKLVKRMAQSGVDATVINVVDNYSLGVTTERIMRVNEIVSKAAAKHPGKIIALAGLDPRRPDAPALLRKCLAEFKMSGLKWHPDNGYYPNGQEAYAMLQVLNEYGYPLLTHCSPLPHSRAKFAHPIHLDDIAIDFPNVEIIAAHMGHLWWHEWAALAQFKKNINGDLAMWQLVAMARPAIFRRYLREILDNIGPYQVVWSTDAPVFEPMISTAQFIEIMRGLTKKDSSGIVFTPEEVEAMLGGNAARIFKLKK